MTSIENFAFSFNDELRTIEIPEGVTTIGISAFLFCGNLTEVKIPASVVEICDSAFCGCWSLTEIILPVNLVTLGNNVFNNCSNLREINLPNGLRKIGRGAFKGCENLTEIKIPATVTEIGDEVFAGCEALEKIYCAAKFPLIENLRGSNAEIITLDESAEENLSWTLEGDTLTVEFPATQESSMNGMRAQRNLKIAKDAVESVRPGTELVFRLAPLRDENEAKLKELFGSSLTIN